MAASLQQQIDAINDAILKVSSGIKRFRDPNGGEVEYASLADLLKSKGDLEAQLATQTDGVYVPGAIEGLTGI